MSIDITTLAIAKEYTNRMIGSGGTGSGVNGKDGITPHIGDNGNWFIGTVDTEVPAQGPAGENGVTPHIGTNGNWYIGSTDTGVSAKGVKGDTGEPGAKGDKGDTGAQGEPGKDGSDGKDGISATHSWNGTVLSITSASGTSSVDLKGEKGDTGAKGDTGSQGEKGDPGATGPKGDTGEKGDDGADGGHYTPIVTQPTSDTMQISFTPSKSDMPNVNPVTVSLPVSENSGENVTEHRLNGHTMGVIGDSLSDPSRQVTQWFDWIATRAGGMEFVLDCVSGRRLMQFPSNTMSTACDVICVFGGTNDFNSAQSLGTIDDTTSDTFYGAVYKLATELRTNYPNALLVFITPMSSAPDYNSGENLKWHQFPQMGGHTVQDFADAIREVCGYLHIPVVDLFRDSGLNYNYDDPVDPYWVSDKLHLTSRGQEAISYVIEDTILRHYIPDNAQTGNVVSLVSIDAVFTQGDTIITTDSALSQLRDMLVVTANYSDGTSEVVTAYSLSGSISEVGTQTITVMYGGKRTTFDVTVGPSGAIDSTVLTLTVEAITEADIGETAPISFDVGEDGSVTPNYVEWRAFWCLPLFDVSGATSITPDALEGPGRQAKTGQYVATPKLDCGVLYYDGDMNLIAYAICADTSYQYGTGDNRDENYVEVLKGSDVAELNGIPVVHYAMTKNYDYYGMNIASPIIPVPETAVFARVSFYPGSNNASGVLIGDEINVIISY